MESKDPRWNQLDDQDKARIDELITNPQKEFPVELFPDECQKAINYFATNLEHNKEICSVGVLSALASAIGLKASIKTDFTNFPVIWTAVVAKSGFGKTPAIDKVIEPLRALDKINAETFAGENDAYKSSPKTLPKPKLSQRIVSDFTIEALLDVHKHNKNGLLIYVDELMGFINSFGQYKSGKSGEQEIYLSLHDARSVVVNRKTSDPITLDRSCVSILGGMQPSKLFDFLRDGRSEDGFLYRFCFVYVPKFKKKKNLNKVRDENIETTYANYVKHIAESTFELTWKKR